MHRLTDVIPIWKLSNAITAYLTGQQHFAGWVCGPVAHGEDVDRQVNAAWRVQVLLVLLEGQHNVLGQLHVLEHPFQLAGEPTSALCQQVFGYKLLQVQNSEGLLQVVSQVEQLTEPTHPRKNLWWKMKKKPKKRKSLISCSSSLESADKISANKFESTILLSTVLTTIQIFEWLKTSKTVQVFKTKTKAQFFS